MQTVVESYSKTINKEYIYEIGKRNKKIVLSIKLDSTNFFHLTGLHHINHLKVRPQVFFNRCLKGFYDKEELLRYFSLNSTSYFSDREYHELRLDVVKMLDELLSEPTKFVFKKIKKKTYYSAGANFNFSYCIEKILKSNSGEEYKAIIYFVYDKTENNVEELKLQSISIKPHYFEIAQLSIWTIIGHRVIENKHLG